MAAIRLSLAELPAWLDARAQALTNPDLTRPLKVIRLLVIADTKRNFAGSHDPDGVPWAPLQWRKGPPLRDNGLLMASLSGSPVEGSIDSLTARGLTFGTNLVYAGVQQWGATISQPERTRGAGEKPWVFQTKDGRTVFTKRIRARTFTVPARPFLGIGMQLRDKINGVLGKYVQGLATGNEK